MKASIEIRFEGHRPKRSGCAEHPWPFEHLKGDQVYGFGLYETALEGCEVRNISWMLDNDTVIIFAELLPGVHLEGEAYDHACETLEMFGWNVQAHIPTIVQDPETGEWQEKKEDDDDEPCYM